MNGFLRIPAILALSIGCLSSAPCAFGQPGALDAGATPKPTLPQKPVAPASAQLPGSVEGKVTTIAGQPIIGANVDIVKIGSPHKRFEVQTDRDGKYSIPKLEPGQWKLSFSAAGMLASQERIVINSGQAVSANAELEDIEASDVLRVTGKRTLIHAEKIGTTTALDRKFLNEYGSGNDLRKDIATTPGVVQDSVGNIITRGEHNAVNYELDGVVLPEAAGVLSQSNFASPRSLDSVTVDIGGYQASDGGGPLGAVVRMKSRSTPDKPTAEFGVQMGGPVQGGINYFIGGPLSQKSNSILSKIKFQSSGTVYGTALGIEAPVRRFARNGRANINTLTKIDFAPTDKDRLKLTIGINESFLGWPTSKTSQRAGVRINEHDREDYVILGYKRLGEKYFDQANINIVNAFYSQRLTSRNVFDPTPILVGEEPFIGSTAATATRSNYVFSAQGDIRKKIHTHNVTAGFLSEVRPVRTSYSAFYYSADPALAVSSQQNQAAAQQAAIDATLATPASEAETAEATAAAAAAQQAAADAALAGGATEEDATAIGQSAADSTLAQLESDRQVLLQGSAQQAGQAALAATPVVPFGSLISPFTRVPFGPQFLGKTGNFKGFRYLQSAYLQDVWRPERGVLKRLTVDAGVRVDVYHGVFGNTMRVANLMAQAPGIQPFDITPFKSQSVTDAQVSGRFGAAYALTNTTAIRGSFAQIFQPPPVDLFSTPPNLTEAPVNGIYPGTLRPLRATRGQLVDASIEQQIGPRFVLRTNLFYKQLKNFGDSGVVQNTPLYNRLTLSNQEAYGVESRVDLKPARDGYGFNGFLSSTVSIAKLRGSKGVTGGVYEFAPEPSTVNYPDHDRRLACVGGFGYRQKSGFWTLSDMQVLTGLKDSLDQARFGPQPARTPVITVVGLNFGYDLPQDKTKAHRAMPYGFDVRIENMLNQRKPLNLGSPYQGTRFSLPFRVIAGINWKV